MFIMSPINHNSKILIMEICVIYFLCILSLGYSTDYYELLGISSNADNREIRTAFKKLALKYHPDKIKDKADDAQEKFIAINKAYEVLKDEEMRKKYDLYGEEGLKEDFGKTWKGNYHSWNYYSESFGIYDDDPVIITLNRHEFVQQVLESSNIWFINFYSPQCSHCHHLAPAWRELAREMRNVIQIGAVNCEEDWMLCRQQNIHSYPSLMLYPKNQKYQGSRNIDDLTSFVMEELPNKVIKFNSNTFTEIIQNKGLLKQWLVFPCYNEGCYDQSDIKKCAIIFDNLINVAVVDDKEVCDRLSCNQKIVYYSKLSADKFNEQFIDLSSAEFDIRDLEERVLNLLPKPREISETVLKAMISSDIKHETHEPHLIQFIQSSSKTDYTDVELKRLNALLPEVSVGYFDCGKYLQLCSSLYVLKYPTYILFKASGSYEFYHGRIAVHDVVRFAKETLQSQVKTLTPNDFPFVIESGEKWFIDFFAPWCPPCMELLPQWRKISQSFGNNVKFGTVDCTSHVTLCRQYQINSYPTTIFYNQSIPHKFSGSHHQMKEFVQDILHPAIISLSPASFDSLIQSKKSNEIWVVDYFAPWCGACQQLTPHWRKLAKMFQDVPSVKVGEVNCQEYPSICDTMNINSYPTIHLYPSNSYGTKRIITYNGRSRDTTFLQAWVYEFLPSSVESLTSSTFKELLADYRPWIVDFFAPWCSHCQVFAPEFHKNAQIFGDKIKFGKVNCDIYPNECRMAGVRAYPTVLFYNGRKGQATQNPIGIEMQTLTYDGIYSFLSRWQDLNKIQKQPKTEL